MKTQPRLLWVLIVGLGMAGTPLAARAAAPPPALTPSVAATNAPAPGAPEDIEQTQRQIARQYLPGLILFLAGALSLSVLLWIKSRDMEALRKQGFFQNETEPKE